MICCGKTKTQQNQVQDKTGFVETKPPENKSQEDETQDTRFRELLGILEKFDDNPKARDEDIKENIKTEDLILKREALKYEGQTVLHVAISKGHVKLINSLFKSLEAEADYEAILEQMLTAEAKGEKFEKTVLLGEQPLIVAALTLKEDVFETILNRGESLKWKTPRNLKDWLTAKTDRKKNNILHCLITYSHLFPSKKNRVEMFRQVINEMERIENEQDVGDLMATLLQATNVKGHTPLVHAAYLGQVDLFKILIENKHYCEKGTYDALFDIKLYKTNEIDTCIDHPTQTWYGNDGQNQATEKVERTSILRIVHNSNADVAAALVRVKPINRAIRKKWNKYHPVFYPFFAIHFIYMFLLTWYCIERSVRDKDLLQQNINCPRNIYQHGFTANFHFVSLLIALPHLFLEGVRLVAGLDKHIREIGGPCDALQLFVRAFRSFDNAYGNVWFRLCFVLMSCFLIADIGLVFGVECYDNYMLLCALVTGWFACLFFVRAFQRFSFFTVLIQKVMLNELLSFFIVYLVQLVALGTAFYMLIQGSPVQEQEDYMTYWRLLFGFTRLAVGNGELNDIYSVKYPGLALAVFTVYVGITVILLLNALIAILSNSSTVATEGDAITRNSHVYLQRLSIILFIEDSLVFRKCKSPAGKRYVKGSNQVIPKIKIKSLRKADDPIEVEEGEIYEAKDE